MSGNEQRGLDAVTPSPSPQMLGDDHTETLHSEATPEGGVISLCKWPEGYVLWHHGEIAWRSWLNKPQQISVTLSADMKPIQDAMAAAQHVFGWQTVGYQWRLRISADDTWSPWHDGPSPVPPPEGCEIQERPIYVPASVEDQP